MAALSKCPAAGRAGQGRFPRGACGGGCGVGRWRVCGYAPGACVVPAEGCRGAAAAAEVRGTFSCGGESADLGPVGH